MSGQLKPISDVELASRLGAVAHLLSRARSVLFITGAGLSADSGLPTYRGVGGLYARQDSGALSQEPEDVLTGETLVSNPALVWEYLLNIEKASRGAQPNRGHEVIAEIEATLPRVVVMTQNVDGFHLKAGSRNVFDVHGDLHKLKCTVCEWRETVVDYAHLPPLPLCPSCNALVRPDVVLFNEMLDPLKMHVLKRELRRGFDLIFSVGTSSLFNYIIYPVTMAIEEHVPTVEINPGETSLSNAVRYQLPLRAAEALELLWRQAKALRESHTPQA